MRIRENKNNMFICSNDNWTYLFSYDSPIAKVNNTIWSNKEDSEQDYGLYFTVNWDYSQTTLKQLYHFIELYTTQRDDRDMTFGYMLDQVNNKREYLQKQIDLGKIKMIRECEF